MPKEKANATSKLLSVDSIRHAEYYGMQRTFDDLYAKSKNGEMFENLMDIVLSRENILLAYRNMKSNTGSRTAGTDKLNIFDIAVKGAGHHHNPAHALPHCGGKGQIYTGGEQARLPAKAGTQERNSQAL